MGFLYTLAAFLSLALFANCINGRKDSGEYWRKGHVMENKPKLAQGLVHVDDCDHGLSSSNYKRPFVDDFEPRPSATAYVDNLKPTILRDFGPRASLTNYVDNLKPKGDQSYKNDFEPIPNVSAYTDDVKKENAKSFNKNFEPIPNVSAYTDDVKKENAKSFGKDFEPIPNVSAYTDDVKSEGGKSLVRKETEKKMEDKKNGSFNYVE